MNAATMVFHPKRWWRLSRMAAGAWLGWLAAMIILFLQYQLQVYRTWGELFFVFASFGAICSTLGILGGFWGLLIGPKRKRAFQWAFLASLPLGLWASFAMYMILHQNQKLVPFNTIHRMGRYMGISMMELHAKYLYPHRLESDHLVMFFDDRTTDPVGDLKILDEHMQFLERFTGSKLKRKPWLVRGKTLGYGSLCAQGIALGSSESPPSALDRHELGHAFAFALLGFENDPPFLFIEGWAMVAEGQGKVPSWCYQETQLIRLQRGFHPDAPEPPIGSLLKELVSEPTYHIDRGAIYPLGGCFVEYLISKHGVEKFLNLCGSTYASSFLTDVQRTYGVSIEEMEIDFFAELDRRQLNPPR